MVISIKKQKQKQKQVSRQTSKSINYDQYLVYAVFIAVLIFGSINLSNPLFEDESYWYAPKIMSIAENNLNFFSKSIPSSLSDFREITYPYSIGVIQDLGRTNILYFVFSALAYKLGGLLFLKILALLASLASLYLVFLISKDYVPVVLLASSALFLGFSTRILPAIFVTLTALWLIYNYQNKNKNLYLLASLILVFLKETGVAILAGMLLFQLLKKNWEYVKLSLISLFAWGLFYYFRRDFATKQINKILSAGSVDAVIQTAHFVFIDQYRWILTLILLFFIVKNKETDLVNIILFTTIPLIVMRGIYLGHLRHVLPVIALLVIAYSIALKPLVKYHKYLPHIILTVFVLLSFTTYFENTSIDFEENLRYQTILKLNQEAYDFVGKLDDVQLYSDIYTVIDLSYPYVGYVDETLNIYPINEMDAKFEPGDIIIENYWSMNDLWRDEYTYLPTIKKTVLFENSKGDDFVKVYRVNG